MEEYLKKSIAVKQTALADIEFLTRAEEAGQHIYHSLKAGKRLYIAGNGGSAADAQHFSAELLGKYKSPRKAYPAIALTTDSSLLTAWSNDVGFNFIFARQLEALGCKDDVFIAISTSGNSANILEALNTANALDMTTVGLLGNEGGLAKGLCRIPIVVPSATTSHIQEVHGTLIHFFCEYFEDGE